jgi:hypothetical protein
MDPLIEFPELQRLVDLRMAGWKFIARHDAVRELDQVDGLRMWPEGHADALKVRSQTDASAVRFDPAGGLRWSSTGTVVDVVDALLALPIPSDPLAP